MALRPVMRLLKLRGFPILEQLRIEERLLRTTTDNWCILNDGTAPPTIVMGISGDPGSLLDIDSVRRDRVPVVKRFSGGGTVIVDENTLFVTVICNRGAVPSLKLYPAPLMEWTAEFYGRAFKDFVPNFSLKQQDYAIGDRKFGGNAQSITKDRWLHHTSFLWDFDSSRMSYLKLPERAPVYRLISPRLRLSSQGSLTNTLKLRAMREEWFNAFFLTRGMQPRRLYPSGRWEISSSAIDEAPECVRNRKRARRARALAMVKGAVLSVSRHIGAAVRRNGGGMLQPFGVIVRRSHGLGLPTGMFKPPTQPVHPEHELIWDGGDGHPEPMFPEGGGEGPIGKWECVAWLSGAIGAFGLVGLAAKFWSAAHPAPYPRREYVWLEEWDLLKLKEGEEGL